MSRFLAAASPAYAAPCRPGGLLAKLLAQAALRRSRRSLVELGPERLRDLNLSREEVLREARRPVWDRPDCWLR